MSLFDLIQGHKRGMIYETARRTIDVFGISDVPTDDELRRVCEGVELELVEQPLPNGLAEVFKPGVLVIDPKLNPEQRRWAIAHGLGHYLLGHGGDQMGLDKRWRWRQEREADLFAGFLLVRTTLIARTGSVYDLSDQARVPIDRVIAWSGWLAVSPWSSAG